MAAWDFTASELLLDGHTLNFRLSLSSSYPEPQSGPGPVETAMHFLGRGGGGLRTPCRSTRHGTLQAVTLKPLSPAKAFHETHGQDNTAAQRARDCLRRSHLTWLHRVLPQEGRASPALVSFLPPTAQVCGLCVSSPDSISVSLCLSVCLHRTPCTSVSGPVSLGSSVLVSGPPVFFTWLFRSDHPPPTDSQTACAPLSLSLWPPLPMSVLCVRGTLSPTLHLLPVSRVHPSGSGSVSVPLSVRTHHKRPK